MNIHIIRNIDYSFDYDFTNKTGLLGENWEAYADGLLNMAKKTVFILFRHTHPFVKSEARTQKRV